MQPNTLLDEVWRAIPSQPELLASSWGRILRRPFQKAMPHGGLRWYRGRPTYGYRVYSTGLAKFRMHLRITGLNRNFRPARLICEAFHGLPPTPKHVAMHIDDDPGNNRPENLKWGTQKENLNTPQFIAYCKSRVGENSPSSKHKARL